MRAVLGLCGCRGFLAGCQGRCGDRVAGKESDVDGEAAPGQGAGPDGGAVGGGDGADDGQAEAVAAVAAGGARAEPLEGLEQAVDLGGGMTCPELVTERTARPPLVAVATSDVAAGDVVPDGVVDQVGH